MRGILRNIKTMEKNIKFAAFIFMLGVFFFTPATSQAADLGFTPSTISRTVGSTFTISAYVSSPSAAINAVSGSVSFPVNILEVVSISKLNSIMNLWVQEPSFSNAQGTASFEGIVLNPGFTGSQGTVVSITFRAKSAGSALIKFSSGSVLSNDGIGTNVLKNLGNANATIRSVEIKPEEKKPLADPVVDTAKKDVVIEKPIITYYQEEVTSGDMIKIHGIARPDLNIKINLLRDGQLVKSEVVRSTGSGNFVIIIDSMPDPGVYAFTVEAYDDAGNIAEKTEPLSIIVKSKWLDSFVDSILKYASLTLVLILALVGLVTVAGILWSHSLFVIRRMRHEAREAEQVSGREFKVLHENINRHVARLKKTNRKLTAEEVEFLEQFDQRLEEAEESIEKEMKDVSK